MKLGGRVNDDEGRGVWGGEGGTEYILMNPLQIRVAAEHHRLHSGGAAFLQDGNYGRKTAILVRRMK